MNRQKQCLCPICKKHPVRFACKTLVSTCPIPPVSAHSGIQMQLACVDNLIIHKTEKIAFDELLNHQGSGITYNAGIFTLIQPGDYLVNWQIALEGSDTTAYVRFALLVDGEVYGPSAYPASLGLISASSLVTTQKPNTQISLINFTGERVRLAPITPIANIVITTAF